MTIQELLDALLKIEDKSLTVCTYQYYNGGPSAAMDVRVLPEDNYERPWMDSSEHNDKDLMVVIT